MPHLSVKLLWRGEECWREFLNLLNVAEAAATEAPSYAMDGGPYSGQNTDGFIVRKKSVILLSSFWFLDFHDFLLVMFRILITNLSFLGSQPTKKEVTWNWRKNDS